MIKYNVKTLAMTAVAVVFIAAIIWWGAGSPQIAPTPSPTPASTPSSTTSNQTNPPAPSPLPSPLPKSLSPTPPPAGSNVVPSTVHIVTPAPNAPWVQGTNNTISWNKESGIIGGIYLVNAGDGSLVGWILQQTSPHQTSFEWNTRDVLENRTSPTKKTVGAGQYIVKVAFDGGNPKFEISSGVFSVIYPSQVQISSYSFTIQNYTFSPSAISAAQGSKLTFKNNDPVAQQILLASHSPITIQPGDSYTFDTSSLVPGPYTFYSNSYPTLRLTLTISAAK